MSHFQQPDGMAIVDEAEPEVDEDAELFGDLTIKTKES